MGMFCILLVALYSICVGGGSTPQGSNRKDEDMFVACDENVHPAFRYYCAWNPEIFPVQRKRLDAFPALAGNPTPLSDMDKLVKASHILLYQLLSKMTIDDAEQARVATEETAQKDIPSLNSVVTNASRKESEEDIIFESPVSGQDAIIKSDHTKFWSQGYYEGQGISKVEPNRGPNLYDVGKNAVRKNTSNPQTPGPNPKGQKQSSSFPGRKKNSPNDNQLLEEACRQADDERAALQRDFDKAPGSWISPALLQRIAVKITGERGTIGVAEGSLYISPDSCIRPESRLPLQNEFHKNHSIDDLHIKMIYDAQKILPDKTEIGQSFEWRQQDDGTRDLQITIITEDVKLELRLGEVLGIKKVKNRRNLKMQYTDKMLVFWGPTGKETFSPNTPPRGVPVSMNLTFIELLCEDSPGELINASRRLVFITDKIVDYESRKILLSLFQNREDVSAPFEVGKDLTKRQRAALDRIQFVLWTGFKEGSEVAVPLSFTF